MKRIVLECILVFTFVLIFNLFVYINYDHIIDFTHCYSIADGLKIYKDFNIVVGPVYPTLISFFLCIFGKSRIIFDIINSLISVCVYLLIRKNNKNAILFILTPFFLKGIIAKYNTFILLLFYILYELEKSNNKYKDYYIGVLLGIVFFTKINMGIYLIFPTLFLYYKNIKVILKRALFFCVASLLIVSVMLINGVFMDFFNYTIMGISSFSKNNTSIEFPILFIVITIIYLIKKIKTDKLLIYMMCYLFMSYPIFEQYHVINAIIPTFFYFTRDIGNFSKKFIFILFVIIFIFPLIYGDNLVANKKSVHNVWQCNNPSCFYTDNVILVNNYLNDYKNYRLFFLNHEAYIFKLIRNEPIDKYDFIWEGNMGKDGTNEYIKEMDEICDNKKCIFILRRYVFGQLSYRIIEHVREKYIFIDDVLVNNSGYSVYTNDAYLKYNYNTIDFNKK